MEYSSDVNQRVVERPQDREDRQNAEIRGDESEEGEDNAGQRNQLNRRKSGDSEHFQHSDPCRSLDEGQQLVVSEFTGD